MRRFLPLLALLVVALAAVPSGAGAADSHAPKGARLDWLPPTEWVMSAWLPFDRARLEQVMDVDEDGLRTWLDDHRTLQQLAARQHVRGSLDALAHRLVGPRLAHASAARRAVLLSRTRDMLTQAHLSRHVLFHVFHTPAIADGARGVFGVSPARFRALRQSGHSPAGIAAIGHRTQAHVSGALWSLLRARAARGVRLGAMSRRQADALLAMQHDQLNTYILHTFRTPEQQIAFLCRPH